MRIKINVSSGGIQSAVEEDDGQSGIILDVRDYDMGELYEQDQELEHVERDGDGDAFHRYEVSVS